jgi:predicted ATPase
MRQPHIRTAGALTYPEIQRRIAELQRNGGATILPITDEEIAAKRAIETSRGEPYAETEWNEAAANLRAFVGLLSEWSEREA